MFWELVEERSPYHFCKVGFFNLRIWSPPAHFFKYKYTEVSSRVKTLCSEKDIPPSLFDEERLSKEASSSGAPVSSWTLFSY